MTRALSRGQEPLTSTKISSSVERVDLSVPCVVVLSAQGCAILGMIASKLHWLLSAIVIICICVQEYKASSMRNMTNACI